MYETLYVYHASMKIEELYRENAWSTYEIQNVYFQKLFQPNMDVDFISKDGVACHKTQRIM